MSGFFSVYGISTGLLVSGDDIISRVISSLEDTDAKTIEDGDILLFAESPLSTTEGRNVRLDDITPSAEAYRLAEKYLLDPRLTEVILMESDTIVGGIPGFLLAGKWGLILPNAGVDESNAPNGWVTRLPADPEATALQLRDQIKERTGKETAVIIIDSRTHSMRLGVSGVAIGCSGIVPITDERGKPDLYGNKLQVTRRAIADSLASTAELLMGESSEGVPVVLVRGYPYVKSENCRIETIPAEEDLFLNLGK
ncbi:MAG TPA: coenzyme F420-0:L-glutamate ligase [Methanocorpusculum sp.]|nr:coenzyme F420-0:L-glutamate ligase [Methanocorpusculum sp.]